MTISLTNTQHQLDANEQIDQKSTIDHPLRVLYLADPFIPVPPRHYGGIERVIEMLCHDLQNQGHKIGLVAHADSTMDCEFFPFSRSPDNSVRQKINCALATYRAVRTFRPDVIHSFGRLAYLWPLLRTSTPKIMSYQRLPTLSRIRNTARFSRKDTLLFTGCSNHITHQLGQVATAETVYNGVPMDRYEFQEVVAPDAPLVFLGRIEEIKGTHNAIQIAKASGRQLIIAGNIPSDPVSQSYFKTRVEPHLSESIKYIGPVDDRQKNELLGSAAAFVMAIEWEEPFGIVMAEALACGTPILGTPRGSVPEIVEDGVTGFISSDMDELSRAVSQLSTLSRSDCRRQCEARFSSSAISDSYLRLYRKMLESRR